MSGSSPTGKQLQASAYYRRFLDNRFRQFTLAGLVADDEPILLRQIYVPLVLTPEPISDHAPEYELHKNGRGLLDWLLPTSKAISRHHSTRNVYFISGEAGSGKTTLARSLVTSLASSISDEFNQTLKDYLPFPILLRDAPIDSLSSLDDLVNWWLDEVREEESAFIPADITSFLDAGRGILLLDGLDELGSQERRQRVLNWVLSHRWTNPKHRNTPNLTIITARPSGFEALAYPQDLPARQNLYITPFSLEQIRTFLKKWFELRPLSPTRRSEQVESFIGRLTDEPRMSQLRALARRPAYLTSLAFVHGTRGALPHTRAALYDSLLDAYIDTLDRQRGLVVRPWDRQEKRDVLAAVAFHAHTGTTSDGNPFINGGRRFTWSREELTETVQRAIRQGQMRFRTLKPEDARELTDYFIARTGLLVESHENRYQFGHLSFQEYLTALYILDKASGSADKIEALNKILLSRLANPGWAEVALLALAVDATRTQGTGHRAVLAKLRPTSKAHVDFIGLILSGEELPLEQSERRAWVIAWIVHASISTSDDLAFATIRLTSNQEAIELVWHATCRAVQEKQDLKNTLRNLIYHPQHNSAPDTDILDELDHLSGGIDPIEAPYRWVDSLAVPDEREFAANILVTPRAGEFTPERAEEKLVALAKCAPLFDPPIASLGIPVPTPYWRMLNEWCSVQEETTGHLTNQTPLAWVCADESTFWPATVAIRWGGEDAAFDNLCLWRRNAWLRLLEVEKWLHCCILSTLGRGQKQERLSEQLTTIARDLDLARLKTLSLTRRINNSEDKELVSNIAQDLSRDFSQHLNATEQFDFDKDNANLLVSVRNLGLQLIEGHKHQWARAPIHLMDPPPEMPSNLATSFMNAWESANLSKPWRRCIATAFKSLVTALACKHILPHSPSQITSNILAVCRTEMHNPDIMAAGISSPQFQARASLEWAGLLRSSFSPAPVLDLLHDLPKKQIDTTPQALISNFERILSAALAST